MSRSLRFRHCPRACTVTGRNTLTESPSARAGRHHTLTLSRAAHRLPTHGSVGTAPRHLSGVTGDARTATAASCSSTEPRAHLTRGLTAASEDPARGATRRWCSGESRRFHRRCGSPGRIDTDTRWRVRAGSPAPRGPGAPRRQPHPQPVRRSVSPCSRIVGPGNPGRRSPIRWLSLSVHANTRAGSRHRRTSTRCLGTPRQAGRTARAVLRS